MRATRVDGDVSQVPLLARPYYREQNTSPTVTSDLAILRTTTCLKCKHCVATHSVVELMLLCAATLMLNRYRTAVELSDSAATVERRAAEGL